MAVQVWASGTRGLPLAAATRAFLSFHMSASSFRQRFNAVTTMSPLQYEEALRLHEAGG
jgi:methylphosphotriester-DNA--protein-cysteine methyltransferase